MRPRARDLGISIGALPLEATLAILRMRGSDGLGLP